MLHATGSAELLHELSGNPGSGVRSLSEATPPQVTCGSQVRDAVQPNGALGTLASDAIASAARGDIESQRLLFQACVEALFDRSGRFAHRHIIAVEAVMLGRLLASHGDATDIRRLAGALCTASTVYRDLGCAAWGDHMMAEGLSVLEQLAERGDDTAALAIHQLIAGEPATVIEQTKALGNRLAFRIPEGNAQ